MLSMAVLVLNLRAVGAGSAAYRAWVLAVYGLALHHDERCVEGARRLGPPQPAYPDEEHYLGAVWRYEWRRDGR